MISLWLDANVVIQLLARDDATHFARARALARRAEGGALLLRLTPVIVAEIYFVLLGRYALERTEVAGAIHDFCTAPGVLVDDLGAVLDALRLAAEQRVDFTDAYLAAKAIAAGDDVASFDRDFERLGVRRAV